MAGTCPESVAQAYINAGIDLPDYCAEFAGLEPQGESTLQASPQEVMSFLGNAVTMGLQVFSSIHGTVTGINPATGQAQTASGVVSVSQLGDTSVSGPEGTVWVSVGGFFQNNAWWILGGAGLAAILFIAMRR